MALAYLLAQAGARPRQIETTASLTLQMSAEGPDVTGIHLRVEAMVDGIDTSAFERIARSREGNLPRLSHPQDGCELGNDAAGVIRPGPTDGGGRSRWPN